MALFTRKNKSGSHRPAAVPSTAIAHGENALPKERRIEEIGVRMLELARAHKSGLLSAKFYSDALMNWSMKDPNFKVQLFRFVDAFPMLKTSDEVFDHLKDYLSQPGVTVPAAIDLALRAGGIAKGIATSQISRQITGMASKFIAGTDAASALPDLRALWDDGIAFSVDLLGEACLSDSEADQYRDKYLDLINNLPAAVSAWKAQPRLETDHLGPIPRTNVSIKISSLSARCDPIDPEGSIDNLMTRLGPILDAAGRLGVFVNFDMEQFALKDLTLDLFTRSCEEFQFDAGLAMQAYLRSGEADARRICDWADKSGKAVTVRLVKGAYWDYQVIHAEQMGWPCPVWSTKRETDACFERMTDIFLDATPRSSPGPTGGGGRVLEAGGGALNAPPGPTGGGGRVFEAGEGALNSSPGPTGGGGRVREAGGGVPGGDARAATEQRTPPPSLAKPRDTPPAGSGGGAGVKLALGSHNVRSIAAALAGLEQRRLPQSAIELQMLHGMADQLKYAAADMGLRVREYVPVGEMIPGMAYLVRRLLENTSNESWLKAGFLDNADPAALLASPHAPNQRAPGSNGHAGPPRAAPDQDSLALSAPERHSLSPAIPGLGNSRPFFNEPFRDFSQADQRSAFAKAVNAATVPRVRIDKTPADGTAMVSAAEKAFPRWRDTDPLQRANVLVRAAALMRQRRDELSGIMIKEAGKTWREADADVCEAIDFCEYYARSAVPLCTRHRLGRFIGELDQTWYQPRGVAVVIAPWNFPLAILTGMTAAALVTGNTVIVKPAEQTPGIARSMYDSLLSAMKAEGVLDPASILSFCPGPGETTGAALVKDKRVALVAFTGSKQVGLSIIREAGITADDQGHVKRVICEMGGKNAIIIDTSADQDEAVLGVRQSAFGFQGQKCSACSRLIVVDPDGPDGETITGFTRRLVEATRALTIGDPALPGTDVGPVIDAEAKVKITGYIRRATDAGLRAHGLAVPAGLEERTGHSYVAPTIFANVPANHELATDEIFGPVLAIIHAGSFQQALDIANASPYKLTGGVFSRKPSHLEQAMEQFRVGNLYLNRGITGALVARQPFGGFGMSGVGSKAGGADYLLQFVEPRASCENTLRRGFAPEL